MSLSPQELTVVAGLGGAIIGAMPGLISSLINRRTEERKQFKELVIKAAIESWKTTVEHSKAVMPLEHYIVHSAKMCEFVLSDKKVTAETMRAHLQEVGALMDVLSVHAISAHPKKAG